MDSFSGPRRSRRFSCVAELRGARRISIHCLDRTSKGSRGVKQITVFIVDRSGSDVFCQGFNAVVVSDDVDVPQTVSTEGLR